MVGFAHGRGVPLDAVAGAVGVSMATLRRAFNAGLLNDQRGQRLAALVSDIDWERDNYHV
jgi:predicted amidohydrolase